MSVPPSVQVRSLEAVAYASLVFPPYADLLAPSRGGRRLRERVSMCSRSPYIPPFVYPTRRPSSDFLLYSFWSVCASVSMFVYVGIVPAAAASAFVPLRSVLWSSLTCLGRFTVILPVCSLMGTGVLLSFGLEREHAPTQFGQRPNKVGEAQVELKRLKTGYD
ncbi:hypothetical protein NUW54_g14295 [Trametes sanguinea]|uniref:Uncharacterized protein n=1 Tax=Trametes sanguinea TaxID=158606 RepID=A0ACC1MDU5_9APHY|nr:hypothetical protein NUW54_g14295 [Trametes sanguinea]